MAVLNYWVAIEVIEYILNVFFYFCYIDYRKSFLSCPSLSSLFEFYCIVDSRHLVLSLLQFFSLPDRFQLFTELSLLTIFTVISYSKVIFPFLCLVLLCFC